MYQQRIVIVGAGIVGLCTAYALLKQGMKHVTLLEQATVDHHRGESHGHSRLLRFEYGADLFYSKMVGLSLSRWKRLEQATGCTLFTRTGLLMLGNEADGCTWPSYHIAHNLGLPVRRLSHEICRQLYPQFDPHPYDMLTYNEEDGVLHASTCLRALKKMILELGGHICESVRVSHIAHQQTRLPVRILLDSGSEFVADKVVVAVGPWVHSLLSELLLPVRLTRQYLLYFSGLPLTSFGVPAFPAFIADDLYGFPLLKTGTDWNNLLKIASHTFGPTVEPDESPCIDELAIARVKKKACDLLPPLRHAVLTRVDACMYDVSPDEDFIIDQVPWNPRVVFATGLSGHAFKFGPLLGELVGSLVCDTEPPVSLERFRLARFSSIMQQKVPVA